MFSFLFTIIFLALIVGLIRPSLFSRLLGATSRKRVALAFGLIAFTLSAISIVADPKKANPSPIANETSTHEAVTPVFAFDIPSLIGKNLDQIVSTLGAPNKDNSEPTKQQLALGVNEWSKSYEKDGRELLITYNPATKKVVDLFIPSTDNEDKQHILNVGNLKENDSRYTVEFVKALKNPDTFTGIKIMAK